MSERNLFKSSHLTKKINPNTNRVYKFGRGYMFEEINLYNSKYIKNFLKAYAYFKSLEKIYRKAGSFGGIETSGQSYYRDVVDILSRFKAIDPFDHEQSNYYVPQAKQILSSYETYYDLKWRWETHADYLQENFGSLTPEQKKNYQNLIEQFSELNSINMNEVEKFIETHDKQFPERPFEITERSSILKDLKAGGYDYHLGCLNEKDAIFGELAQICYQKDNQTISNQLLAEMDASSLVLFEENELRLFFIESEQSKLSNLLHAYFEQDERLTKVSGNMKLILDRYWHAKFSLQAKIENLGRKLETKDFFSVFPQIMRLFNAQTKLEKINLLRSRNFMDASAKIIEFQEWEQAFFNPIQSEYNFSYTPSELKSFFEKHYGDGNTKSEQKNASFANIIKRYIEGEKNRQAATFSNPMAQKEFNMSAKAIWTSASHEGLLLNLASEIEGDPLESFQFPDHFYMDSAFFAKNHDYFQTRIMTHMKSGNNAGKEILKYYQNLLILQQWAMRWEYYSRTSFDIEYTQQREKMARHINNLTTIEQGQWWNVSLNQDKAEFWSLTTIEHENLIEILQRLNQQSHFTIDLTPENFISPFSTILSQKIDSQKIASHLHSFTNERLYKELDKQYSAKSIAQDRREASIKKLTQMIQNASQDGDKFFQDYYIDKEEKRCRHIDQALHWMAYYKAILKYVYAEDEIGMQEALDIKNPRSIHGMVYLLDENHKKTKEAVIASKILNRLNSYYEQKLRFQSEVYYLSQFKDLMNNKDYLQLIVMMNKSIKALEEIDLTDFSTSEKCAQVFAEIDFVIQNFMLPASNHIEKYRDRFQPFEDLRVNANKIHKDYIFKIYPIHFRSPELETINDKIDPFSEEYFYFTIHDEMRYKVAADWMSVFSWNDSADFLERDCQQLESRLKALENVIFVERHKKNQIDYDLNQDLEDKISSFFFDYYFEFPQIIGKSEYIISKYSENHQAHIDAKKLLIEVTKFDVKDSEKVRHNIGILKKWKDKLRNIKSNCFIEEITKDNLQKIADYRKSGGEKQFSDIIKKCYSGLVINPNWEKPWEELKQKYELVTRDNIDQLETDYMDFVRSYYERSWIYDFNKEWEDSSSRRIHDIAFKDTQHYIEGLEKSPKTVLLAATHKPSQHLIDQVKSSRRRSIYNLQNRIFYLAEQHSKMLIQDENFRKTNHNFFGQNIIDLLDSKIKQNRSVDDRNSLIPYHAIWQRPSSRPMNILHQHSLNSHKVLELKRNIDSFPKTRNYLTYFFDLEYHAELILEKIYDVFPSNPYTLTGLLDIFPILMSKSFGLLTYKSALSSAEQFVNNLKTGQEDRDVILPFENFVNQQTDDSLFASQPENAPTGASPHILAQQYSQNISTELLQQFLQNQIQKGNQSMSLSRSTSSAIGRRVYVEQFMRNAVGSSNIYAGQRGRQSPMSVFENKPTSRLDVSGSKSPRFVHNQTHIAADMVTLYLLNKGLDHAGYHDPKMREDFNNKTLMTVALLTKYGQDLYNLQQRQRQFGVASSGKQIIEQQAKQLLRFSKKPSLSITPKSLRRALKPLGVVGLGGAIAYEYFDQ